MRKESERHMGFLHFDDKAHAGQFASTSTQLADDAGAYAAAGAVIQGIPGLGFLHFAEVVVVIVYCGAQRLAVRASRVADDPPQWTYTQGTHAVQRYRTYPSVLGDSPMEIGLRDFMQGAFDADADLGAMLRATEKADGAWLVAHGHEPTTRSDPYIAAAALPDRLGEAQHFASAASRGVRTASRGARQLADLFDHEEGARQSQEMHEPDSGSLPDEVLTTLYRTGIRIEDTLKFERLRARGRDSAPYRPLSAALTDWARSAAEYSLTLQRWEPGEFQHADNFEPV